MDQKTLVDEIIKAAAKEANINTEQSFNCLRAAFRSISEKTRQYGGVDLSCLGVPGMFTSPISTLPGRMVN